MEKPIKFARCTCGHKSGTPHAYFFTASDERFPPAPFFSQTAANRCLKHLPMLSDDEKQVLAEQIIASDLPVPVTDDDIKSITTLALGSFIEAMVYMAKSHADDTDDDDTVVPPGATIH